MQGAAGAPDPLIKYIIMAVALSVALIFRVRRLNQARPLRVERLWIIPLVFLLLAALAFATTPPTRDGWAASVVALVVGAALGWQRGRLMKIDVNPDTHRLTTVQSPAAFIFFIILLALKTGIRNLPQTSSGGVFHVPPEILTDVLAAFALGLLAVQRLEMFLRARRLLVEARGQRPL